MDGDSAKIWRKIDYYAGIQSGVDSLFPLEKYAIRDSVRIKISSTRDTFLIDTLPLFGHFTVYKVQAKAYYIKASGDTIKTLGYCTGIPLK
jgi:hypothetical protein